VWLRNFFATHWSHYLTTDAINTLRSSAHYTQVLKRGLRLVSMNTQWNDQINWYLYLMESQYEAELEWLQNILNGSRAHKEKVILMGHISPGKGALSLLSKWAHRYVDLVSEYQDVIVGQFFGHTHTDEFEIMYNNVTKAPFGISYLAPSLTTFVGRNPSVRVYEFDSNFKLLDYVQYYVNLTQTIRTNRATWEQLYRATTYFGLPDLSPASWNSLVTKMKRDSKVFQRWFSIHFAGGPSKPCTSAACIQSWICALTSSDPDTTLSCGDFAEKGPSLDRH